MTHLFNQLYPNVRYFLLLKELPGCKIGEVVNIQFSDSEQYLWVNGVKMAYDTAEKYPEYFDAVENERANEIFKQNTLRHMMLEKNYTLEKAEELYEVFLTS